MTEKRYRAVQAWFYAHPKALTFLRLANKLLPLVIYCAYPLLMGWLLLTHDVRLLRALLIPAGVFLGGTLLRKLLNRPRPYEVYGIPALTPKDTRGQGFPSRHLFSASVITLCALWIWPPLGIILGFVTLLLAPLRVLAGVHFIKDVTVGAVAGAVIGYLGFFVF